MTRSRAMIPLGQREEELGGGRFFTWALSLSFPGCPRLSRGNPFNLPRISKCILPSRKCTILHQNCLSYTSLSPCCLQSARNGEEVLTWCKNGGCLEDKGDHMLSTPTWELSTLFSWSHCRAQSKHVGNETAPSPCCFQAYWPSWFPFLEKASPSFLIKHARLFTVR